MKKISFLATFLISTTLSAQIKTFSPQEKIKASDLNQNFNHIKGLFQSKGQTLPFLNYQSGSLIKKDELESDFDRVRSLGIDVSSLDSDRILATELNKSFSDMIAGASSFDDFPLANNSDFSIDEDTVLNNQVSFVNHVGPSQIQVQSQPSNGILVLNSSTGTFTYTPNLNYFGVDGFSYKVFDGSQTSDLATVSINVLSINDIPVVQPQSFTINEDVPKSLTLTGTDVENSSLTFNIVNPPTNGTLSGTLPNITYTPNLNYFGTDSFTFKANDGEADSLPATVSFTINPVNDAPIALVQLVETNEDTPLNIQLTGTDVENSSLTFTKVSNPSNGTLTGTIPNFTYTPNANFFGTDSFTFKVSDGALESSIATITITVNPINDVPVANAQSIATSVNFPVGGTLTGSDIEGTPLQYSLVTQGTKGLADVNSNGTFTYTPNTNVYGSDSFTIRAFDGTDYSLPVQVSVDISLQKSCTTSVVDGTAAQTFNTTTNTYGSCLIVSCANQKVITADQLDCVYVIASGGTMTTSGNYRIHTFNGNGTFTFTNGRTTNFEVLVVAGGGGGGGTIYGHGGAGGGGAGGYIHSTNQTIPLGNHSITVGGGGSGGVTSPTCGRGGNGGNSTLGAVVSAIGGGGGGVGCTGSTLWGGLTGGSGGGAGFRNYSAGATGGSGTSGQGNRGGNTHTASAAGAGGGGAAGVGANSAGSTGGAGGAGISNSITGSTEIYSIGGRGGIGHTVTAGAANTGRGGDGGRSDSGFTGAAGGSGIVVIKYLYK